MKRPASDDSDVEESKRLDTKHSIILCEDDGSCRTIYIKNAAETVGELCERESLGGLGYRGIQLKRKFCLETLDDETELCHVTWTAESSVGGDVPYTRSIKQAKTYISNINGVEAKIEEVRGELWLDQGRYYEIKKMEDVIINMIDWSEYKIPHEYEPINTFRQNLLPISHKIRDLYEEIGLSQRIENRRSELNYLKDELKSWNIKLKKIVAQPCQWYHRPIDLIPVEIWTKIFYYVGTNSKMNLNATKVWRVSTLWKHAWLSIPLCNRIRVWRYDCTGPHFMEPAILERQTTDVNIGPLISRNELVIRRKKDIKLIQSEQTSVISTYPRGAKEIMGHYKDKDDGQIQLYIKLRDKKQEVLRVYVVGEKTHTVSIRNLTNIQCVYPMSKTTCLVLADSKLCRYEGKIKTATLLDVTELGNITNATISRNGKYMVTAYADAPFMVYRLASKTAVVISSIPKQEKECRDLVCTNAGTIMFICRMCLRVANPPYYDFHSTNITINYPHVLRTDGNFVYDVTPRGVIYRM